MRTPQRLPSSLHNCCVVRFELIKAAAMGRNLASLPRKRWQSGAPPPWRSDVAKQHELGCAAWRLSVPMIEVVLNDRLVRPVMCAANASLSRASSATHPSPACALLRAGQEDSREVQVRRVACDQAWALLLFTSLKR